MHDHLPGGGALGEHRGFERVQGAVAEQVVGVQVGAGHQQVALGLGLARARGPGADLERCFVAAHRVRQGDQGADPVVHAGQQRGGAGEQAVHEPHRRGGPGQRLQQRDHPVRGHELHDHQVHRERGQVRAVADRAGPGPLGSGGGVGPPASAARHLVLVVLGDPHRDLRDLVGLVGVDHAQIPRLGQVGPAVAAPLREPVAAFVRVVGPRQM